MTFNYRTFHGEEELSTAAKVKRKSPDWGLGAGKVS